MSAKSATLAKSLHTVSVIVNVARHLAGTLDALDSPTAAYYAGRALDVLGYSGAADPYTLEARAIAQLKKAAV